MKELYLIYVNKVGKSYKGNYIYEFIFSDTKENVDGDNWDAYPASGRPEQPHDKFIKEVGRLESELRLDVIQDSTEFTVWDSVDGVVALAFENIEQYATYPEKRISFHFGEKQKDIELRLYEKDLVLNYEYKKKLKD